MGRQDCVKSAAHIPAVHHLRHECAVHFCTTRVDCEDVGVHQIRRSRCWPALIESLTLCATASIASFSGERLAAVCATPYELKHLKVVPLLPHPTLPVQPKVRPVEREFAFLLCKTAE